MLDDVVDGMKMVSDAISQIQKIVNAIETGRDYLKVKHPEVEEEVSLLLRELSKNVSLIKQASAIITNFRFAASSEDEVNQLTRFNDYYIKSKAEADDLRLHIEDLRSHCSQVRGYAFSITDKTQVNGFSGIFELFGLSDKKKEEELGGYLDRLAYEDFEVANSAEIMLGFVHKALSDIQSSLETDGLMTEENISKAAKLLAQYSVTFEKMEECSILTLSSIRKTISELRI
ncbi:MAG: hypothetical protein COA45_12110 [Zetaproteobacteria bacterium]|nr:MAG: hypothetical protein COA45_12110 [Zetaproteobacteria bacterium]